MGRLSGTTINTAQPQAAPQSGGRLKANLSTVPGLEKAANKFGLQDEVSRIPARGEDPNKIFSGGFISDVFDTLNALDYGVVGTLQGKGFVEGVKTRASFTENFKDAGIPGLIAGIALDIAVDPLTYINPAAALTKISKATKLDTPLKAVGKLAKESKIGQFTGRNLVYGFGQDPIYREMAERNIKNSAIQNQSIVRMFDDIKNISPSDQKIVAEARKAGALDTLDPVLRAKVAPVFARLDQLSQEAIQYLDLSPEMKKAYESGIGTYMKRMYRRFEEPMPLGRLAGMATQKPKRIEGSLFKARKDIPDDLRQAWGEIEEFGYPTAKAMLQLNTAVENAKFFRETASKFGSDVAEEGLFKLADTPRLGALSGKHVPRPIFDSINEIIRTPGDTEKLLRPVVGAFKYAKVILNPATHARNVASNLVLNNFEGLSPARLDIYALAGRELVKKGKWYQEALEKGLGLDTYAAQEIKGLLSGPDVSALGKAKGAIGKAADKIAEIYQKEEEFAKLAQYIFQRKKGLSGDEAWKIAERATFNYAQVTPAIRRLRESIFGYPFITFTYKATPQVLRTAVTRPTKISNIGKIKEGIENFTDQEELKRERASEPDWVRNGFYLKLPIKDEYGRSAYMDLTYILPFGDLVSGNFFEKGVDRDTGLSEGVPEATVRKLAFPNMIKEMVTNEDFFGNKIYKESDSTPEQLRDIMGYLTRMFAPPLLADQLPGGYRADGTRRPGLVSRVSGLPATADELEFGETQTRTLQQELLKATGIKLNPVDIETQEAMQKSQQKKALETILKESGKTREFKRTYIPK